MPFGGDNPKERDHFTGVYKRIIKPAAEALGYNVVRSDTNRAPGNITNDIVNGLAESNIVIADLTSANANVFFELGTRHAFRKSGTVHIMDKSHKLPFDLRNYRVIEYTTDLVDQENIINLISEAIKHREKSPEKSDNPIHDALSDLPMNILQAGDNALKDQIERLQERTDILEKEREKLQARLYELNPEEKYSNENDDEIDIDKLLDEADTIHSTTGQNVVLKLKKALEEGGQETFIGTLRKILKNPYLSSSDFSQIADMCRDQQLLDHRRAVLQIGSKNYPTSDSLHLGLIDAYDDSPNRVYQTRGRMLIEKFLGITHDANGPKITSTDLERSKGINILSRGFGILFNFYFRMGKPNWVQVIAEKAKEEGIENALILRNLARSYASTGNINKAEEMYLYALEKYPDDDTTYALYGDLLDDEGKYDLAYENTEKGIIADPEDGSRWINLAIQILNRGYVRDSNGILIGPIDKKERLKHALPFFLKALKINGNRHANNIINVLVKADALEIAQKLYDNELLEEDYNDSSVNHVFKQL